MAKSNSWYRAFSNILGSDLHRADEAKYISGVVVVHVGNGGRRDSSSSLLGALPDHMLSGESEKC